MDIISNKPMFKKRILLIWAGTLAAFHIIFTLLSMWHSHIRGDIMHSTADNVLTYLIPFLAFLIIYVRFAVMVSAYHSYDNAGTIPFTAVVVASFLVSKISDMIIKNFAYANFDKMFNDELIGAFLSFMIELAIVIIIFMFSRSKSEKSRTVTRLIIITCLFPLVISLFEETWFLVAFLKEIREIDGSMMLRPDEFAAIVKAFVIPIVEAALGFGVIYGVHILLIKYENMLTGKTAHKK